MADISPQGLSTHEVEERKKAGLVNTSPEKITKSTGEIFKDNIFTLFNLFNVLIAIALISVGAYSNCFFILIIAVNTAIGIFQELRAKKMVEELSILTLPTALVVRDGKKQTIPLEEVVKDDILLLTSGDQIGTDSILQAGSLEVNESMLTGESDLILKQAGDFLYSGSFVVSGKAAAKVENVGSDNYAAKMAHEVKKFRRIHSELLTSMQKVTKFTGFLIVPLGIILLCQALFSRHMDLNPAVVSTSAALLGMLPKGFVLLISINLAVGIQKLAKKKVLVQELYALETLAHVDVLCLDKTGTLTEGKMKVEDIIAFSDDGKETFNEYIPSFLAHTDDVNATFLAMNDYFTKEAKYSLTSKVPFASERKWSSVTFADNGSIVIGAPERLLTGEAPDFIKKETAKGRRVLVAGYTQEVLSSDSTPVVTPLVAIVIADAIRSNAIETLSYFEEEGVALKIISGDTVDTVSALAKQVGFSNAESCVDCSAISSDEEMSKAALEYSVFGRVSPNQKKIIVQALQKDGHTVAMTGDGVNDLLALREADCSIAIAEGSDAAKQISQLVLTDSNFASLPSVLAEGRRVVNNVTRLACVFFVKTVYSILLSIVCIILNIPFPFIPIQITLIDLAIEGYPNFFLGFEPDNRKVTGKFIPSVFSRAVPIAISFVAMFLCVTFMAPSFSIDSAQISLLLYGLVSAAGIIAVFKSCIPFNALRVFLVSTMTVGFYVAVLLFHSILEVPLPQKETILLFAIFFVVMFILQAILSVISKKIMKKKLS